MFDNTLAAKRMLKKNALLEALSLAKANNEDWKVRQIESKLALMEKKVFWNSSEKGTYKKEDK